MTDQRPRLTGRFLSPYVRRVAVTLNFYGIPFERLVISAVGDETERERLNPVGRVPALTLPNGETLIDSAAIIDYFDESVGPDQALIPFRGAARCQALFRIALATGAIDRAMAANTERRRTPPDNDRLTRLLRQSAQGFAALENQLADGAYLGGSRLGQADVTTVVGLTFVEHIFPGTLSKTAMPGLFDLANRVEARDEFSRAKID